MLRGEGRAAEPAPAPTRDPAETAAYIAEITTELAELARRSNLDLVAYLLDIAQLEAANTAQRGTPARRREG